MGNSQSNTVSTNVINLSIPPKNDLNVSENLVNNIRYEKQNNYSDSTVDNSIITSTESDSSSHSSESDERTQDETLSYISKNKNQKTNKRDNRDEISGANPLLTKNALKTNMGSSRDSKTVSFITQKDDHSEGIEKEVEDMKNTTNNDLDLTDSNIINLEEKDSSNENEQQVVVDVKLHETQRNSHYSRLGKATFVGNILNISKSKIKSSNNNNNNGNSTDNANSVVTSRSSFTKQINISGNSDFVRRNSEFAKRLVEVFLILL